MTTSALRVADRRRLVTAGHGRALTSGEPAPGDRRVAAPGHVPVDVPADVAVADLSRRVDGALRLSARR